MSSGPGNPRLRRFWRVAIRSVAIIGIGAALGLLSNALHPMGLPLRLGEVDYPGVPLWVWHKVDTLTPEQAYALWQERSVIIVDARDRTEYDEAHIPGSISLPYHEFTTAYPQVRSRLPEDRRILLYCHGGDCPLSMRVAKRLLGMGYTELMVLSEGIIGWRDAGYELTVPGAGGEAAEGAQT